MTKVAKRHTRKSDSGIAEAGSNTAGINPALLEYIENEWLGLGDTSIIPTKNIFDPRSIDDIENPVLHVLSLMRSPEYFYFTCKHLLNREIMPIQACILSEFWHRPFPALFATRGFGKCIVGDSLIVTDKGFARIDSLAKNAPAQQPVCDPSLKVCGENGFKDVAYSWNNGFGPTIKITTHLGYEIEGTPEHPIRVVLDGQAIWKKLEDIEQGDYPLIDLNPCRHWHKPNDLNPGQAYELGLTCDNLPAQVLGCSKTAARAFVQGVLTERKLLPEPLAKSIQFILTRLGIASERMSHGTNLCSLEFDWTSNNNLMSSEWMPSDGIKSISRGLAETYDVHIPNDHSFISNGFVSHNTFLLGVYMMLRLLLNPGVKVVIVGAAFRQSKFVFDVCSNIWNSSPILKDIAGPGSGPRYENDRCSMRIGDSLGIALPVGDGSRIRGERAGILIADELAAQRVDIFENVVSGFAAVSMDPISKVKSAGRERAKIKLKMFTADDSLPAVPGLNSNQTILAGTCYYTFNHSYDYYQRYKKIINSKGDKHVLNDIFNGNIPDKFDWRDYCVMRIPHGMLPPDYMDAKHIAKAKNTLHKSQYLCEYEACFSGDSDGFFKMSMVEQCVVGHNNPNIRFPSTNGEPVYFSATLRGDMQRQYVIAVDPASESDNFAIVVLEIWPDHRRVVYCWTTTRKRHKARLAKNAVKEHDFFQYAARKIRDLCVLFPCARLCVDKMGGGISVMEALGDPERLLEGEVPILPIIEEGVDKPTDRTPGDHILELVYFAKADWVSNANNGLKFDLESKLLLFPAFDGASVGLAMEEDRLMGRIVTSEDGTEDVLYDTLEDCVMNIEEIKEELASIVHSQTGAGRDHWDTPKARDMLGKETRTRKDRYSALLMANMAARTLTLVQARPQYYSTGGFATDLKGAPQQPKGHFNPPAYTSRLQAGQYGAMVPKTRGH